MNKFTHNESNIWKSADNPPKTTLNHWSYNVICVTNYGNVYSLPYTNGGFGGIQQRPSYFEEDEVVKLWTEIPYPIPN